MQYMRFYGNVRFATLTIFAALTGGILTFVFKGDPKLIPESCTKQTVPV